MIDDRALVEKRLFLSYCATKTFSCKDYFFYEKVISTHENYLTRDDVLKLRRLILNQIDNRYVTI